MQAIMKKLAIMRKPMIAISSGPRRRAGHSDAAGTDRSTGSRFNQYERFCCRFAVGAAIGNNRFNS